MEPVTLMVGPAGAGKSNVFKAMVALQNLVHRTLIEMFPPGMGEFRLVRSRWAGETDPIEFKVQMDQLPGYPGCTAEYVVKLADAPDPVGVYVLEETLTRRLGDQPAEWVFQRRGVRTRMGEFGTVEPNSPTVLHRVWHREPSVNFAAPNVGFAIAVAKALSSCGYYHLELTRLRSLGSGQSTERIRYDGGDLPDFIAGAKSDPEHTPIYEAILAEMRQLLPSLESIILTQTRLDRQGLAFTFRDQMGYIAAPDMSDGTMFTLGMLCILNAPQKPLVLCIEEPETGLHPRRLRWLFEKFVTLAYPPAGQLPTQVVLTTHSPSFVDLFKDMLPSIQVVEQREGRTKIQPLPEILQALRMNQDEEDGVGYQWATGLFEGL
jgi:predicted ATPase